MDSKILILGAGISGLSTAFWLNKKGHDLIILEARDEPGGSMQTEMVDNFLIDYGPNSGLETTPLIQTIVEDVGLSKEFVYANQASNNRYIFKNGELHTLPMSPLLFIKTKLFSSKAKLRLLAEPFIGKSEDGYYQSVAEFVRRRLGIEFLDYAIDPFVSGVFAGDPERLSVKSAFPKLYRLEEVYGGLFKGMVKGAKERKKRAEQSKQSAKMFSFLNGMQYFPKAIASKMNEKIIYNCNVINVKKVNNKWETTYIQNGVEKKIISDIIISTVPAYIASRIFYEVDSELSAHLNEIYYPPVMVLYLGFNKEQVGRKLDGFGFLIPSKEKKHFLGAIWNSAIFPNRCDENKAAFTLFIGGARSPHLFDIEIEKLIDMVLSEFKEIMRISTEPVLIKYKLWEKAIPQYNLGYIKHEQYFEKFESNNFGLYLRGNYRGGISVGDCIKNSEINIKILES